MGAAALHALGRNGEIAGHFSDQAAAATVARMLGSGLICPETSSLGRVFDAVAGLLGVRAVAAFEGQAAMLLEGLAERHGPVPPWRGSWRLGDDGNLDLLPLINEYVECRDAGLGAAAFHATLAAALADWAGAAARRENIDVVAFGGGCFLNHILSRELRRLLTEQGLRVLEARRLPPNDGGLCLGQAWVAMQQGSS